MKFKDSGSPDVTQASQPDFNILFLNEWCICYKAEFWYSKNANEFLLNLLNSFSCEGKEINKQNP